jgi:hypothetical protein
MIETRQKKNSTIENKGGRVAGQGTLSFTQRGGEGEEKEEAEDEVASRCR